MQTLNSIAALRAELRQRRLAGERIGFVPTMGNLHAGHIQLVTEARTDCDCVVSSVFVNPTQFGPGEDFDSYPRTLAADQEKLAAAGCDILFAPPVTEMYPDDQADWARVQVFGVSENHCGAARPGHFDGVSTVVTKLFNIVQPDLACFGKKDFQQLAVIRRMTTALCFPVEIRGVETVREASGLAMSSRNGYLSTEEKTQAAKIYELLRALKQQIINGARDYAALESQGIQQLADAGFGPDYLHIANADSLQPATLNDSKLVILVAARLGGARLIDNIDFTVIPNAIA